MIAFLSLPPKVTAILAASTWVTFVSLTQIASAQLTVTETSSTLVILYTTVQPSSTITSSCRPGNINTPWLPLCNQVTWGPVNDTNLTTTNSSNLNSPGGTALLLPTGQVTQLQNQSSGNQDLNNAESPTGAGDGGLSQASSVAKLAQSSSTSDGVQDDVSTATSSIPATPYPSPFPIGGRGKLRNLAVELSPGGVVVFREASDSPQEFINDEAGYIRPVGSPDLVLYIHYDKEAGSRQQEREISSNLDSTVLYNVRAKTQNSTDQYDIENTFTVREGGIQLRGTSDHAEYRFYVGDYEDDNREYEDGVLKLLAAPVGQLVDLEKYNVEEVVLLPFIVRKTTSGDGTTDGEATGSDITGGGTVGAAESMSELLEIITSSSLLPFCSEYLSHITLVHTQTAAHHLVHSHSTSISVVPEMSTEIGAVSTTIVTVQSGVTTEPWPLITSPVDGNTDGEIHHGSDTNVYLEGEATILRKHPVLRRLQQDFDIPDALSIYDPSQISSGCSEVVYKIHHSTSTGERSTFTSSGTVVVASGSTLTLRISQIETFTTTVPSITITPTPMSGRILMYDRGEYNTSPGSLSANYLAPSTTHVSISNPTVVAELVRTDSLSSIFHLDGFGRLYSINQYTGISFYWAEKVKDGGNREEISKLGVGDFILVPEQEIDGFVLTFVTFWIEEDGRIMVDEVYINKTPEIEYMTGWEFIWCYDRTGTLWNYNTAKKYRDEGGQNSELTGILTKRDNPLDECDPQTLTFKKLDGETAADDIMYMDILRRRAGRAKMGKK
ncbi:hypothetical protein TWF718_005389 [Orbilia javanica]|uniref:Uncharacterized protein n=1 Tax=Orbilia javanica TaxID=47235 RepID=A0AAN8N7K7_9PEZI